MAELPPIVTGEWARTADVRLCDVRSSMGGADPIADFTAGHLPGAVLVDLDRDLATPPDGALGRHPLPTPESFAAALRRLGIADDDQVVAYDMVGGGLAARLVWMLRVIGGSAALLDGGAAGWSDRLETGPPAPVTEVERTPVAWPPDAMATADEVAAHVERGGVVVDARANPRYRGEHEPIDSVAGHVPGAINLPFQANLDEAGRFRPLPVLRDRFASAGVDHDAIVYCGSGVTACHDVLAAEAAGLGRPRVYVGSWSGWSSDPDRPVETGGDSPDSA